MKFSRFSDTDLPRYLTSCVSFAVFIKFIFASLLHSSFLFSSRLPAWREFYGEKKKTFFLFGVERRNGGT